jgi:hypothetical protein
MPESFPLHRYGTLQIGNAVPGCDCGGRPVSRLRRALRWLGLIRAPAPICAGHISEIRSTIVEMGEDAVYAQIAEAMATHDALMQEMFQRGSNDA